MTAVGRQDGAADADRLRLYHNVLNPAAVTPANAGAQDLRVGVSASPHPSALEYWVPAFAGMTAGGGG